MHFSVAWYQVDYLRQTRGTAGTKQRVRSVEPDPIRTMHLAVCSHCLVGATNNSWFPVTAKTTFRSPFSGGEFDLVMNNIQADLLCYVA